MPLKHLKRCPAHFYQTKNGTEPVRNWLKSLSTADKKEISGDIQAAEYGWPIGLPLCRPIAGQRGLWEIRSNLVNGRIARIFFTIKRDKIILLHGFEKKSYKTPQQEITLAHKRMKDLT